MVFNEFRGAWRQAVDNFWRELGGEGEEPGSTGAYREVATLRNQLDRLDTEIADTRQRASHEREQVEICVRRERMAAEIGDTETARIAAEYAGRHRERGSVLERKLGALEAERRLCRRDLDEMERVLQERGVDGAKAELEDLNRHPAEGDFRNLEESQRSRSAEERLEELKRRMTE